MSRYIDADALIEFIDLGHYRNPLELCYSEQYVVDMIESRPTADVVEVVRCKDCVNWQTDWDTSYDGYHYCSMIDIVIDGDFYCKDGERKILPKD